MSITQVIILEIVTERETRHLLFFSWQVPQFCFVFFPTHSLLILDSFSNHSHLWSWVTSSCFSDNLPLSDPFLVSLHQTNITWWREIMFDVSVVTVPAFSISRKSTANHTEWQPIVESRRQDFSKHILFLHVYAFLCMFLRFLYLKLLSKTIAWYSMLWIDSPLTPRGKLGVTFEKGSFSWRFAKHKEKLVEEANARNHCIICKWFKNNNYCHHYFPTTLFSSSKPLRSKLRRKCLSCRSNECLMKLWRKVWEYFVVTKQQDCNSWAWRRVTFEVPWFKTICIKCVSWNNERWWQLKSSRKSH